MNAARAAGSSAGRQARAEPGARRRRASGGARPPSASPATGPDRSAPAQRCRCATSNAAAISSMREQLVARRGMAETEQVIGQRLRQVALLAQGTQRLRAVALGQRRSIRAGQQGQMSVARRRQFQRLQDQQLARRIAQVIVAAQQMRHAGQRIIDGIGKEERGRAVGPPQHEVADLGMRETLRAVHQVLECRLRPAPAP